MFEPGQMVVCIDDTPRHPLPESFVIPKKGHIYTIREIYTHPSGVIAITVEEIINNFSDSLGRELGFAIDRFAPLDSYIESKKWANETLTSIVEEMEDEFVVRITRED